MPLCRYSPGKPMRVGFYQFRPLFGKNSRNTRHIISALSTVEADLVVLPELALSGYHFASSEEAMHFAEDPHRSKNLADLVQLCRQRDFYLVIGFAERDQQHCYNSAALIGGEGIIDIYRKLHLFNTEKLTMSCGQMMPQIHTIRGARIAMMICFDWAFPELARSLALHGVQVLCHPSNLVLGFCQDAMITRCLENKVFAITANRFGTDKRPHGTLYFTGKSQVVTPGAEVLRRAPAQRRELYLVDIDTTQADNKRLTPHNDLFADRRTEYY